MIFFLPKQQRSFFKICYQKVIICRIKICQISKSFEFFFNNKINQKKTSEPDPAEFIKELIKTQQFLHAEIEFQKIKSSVISNEKKKNQDLLNQLQHNHKKYFLTLYHLQARSYNFHFENSPRIQTLDDSLISDKKLCNIWEKFKSTFKITDIKSIKNDPNRYKKFMFLIYSLIPSMYGFFLEESLYNDYFTFLKGAIKEKSFFKYFLYPIFFSPNLVYFISHSFKYPLLNYFHQFTKFQRLEPSQFLPILLESWKQNISLCPKVFIDLLETFKSSNNDHKKIITYLLKTIFKNPNLFDVSYYYSDFDDPFRNSIIDALMSSQSLINGFMDSFQNITSSNDIYKIQVPLVFDSFDIQFLKNMNDDNTQTYILYQQKISDDTLFNDESSTLNLWSSLRELLKLSEPFPNFNDDQIDLFRNPSGIYEFIEKYCVVRGSTFKLDRKRKLYEAFKRIKIDKNFANIFQQMKYSHTSEVNELNKISYSYGSLFRSSQYLKFCMDNAEKVLSVHQVQVLDERLKLEKEMHNNIIKFDEYLKNKPGLMIMDSAFNNISLSKIAYKLKAKKINLISEALSIFLQHELNAETSNLSYALSASTDAYQKYLDIKDTLISITTSIRREFDLKDWDELSLYEFILLILRPHYLYPSIVFINDHLFSDKSLLMQNIKDDNSYYSQKLKDDKKIFSDLLNLFFKIMREKNSRENISNILLDSKKIRKNIIICGSSDDLSLKTNILLSCMNTCNTSTFLYPSSTYYQKELAKNGKILTLSFNINIPGISCNVICNTFNLSSPDRCQNLRDYVKNIPIDKILVAYDSSDAKFDFVNQMLKVVSKKFSFKPIILCYDSDKSALDNKLKKKYEIYPIYDNNPKETMLRIVEEMLTIA